MWLEEVNEMPTCRTSCESMGREGGENSSTNFDLDPCDIDLDTWGLDLYDLDLELVPHF